jgi:hypothetical protein
MNAILVSALAVCLAGCATLYPEKSDDREREHEFMEMHMKHIGH